MGTVITVMNMKGGVGKTTVAAHLGGFFAQYDINDRARRVLLIDYDAQFNLSQMFIPAPIYFQLERRRRTSLAILQDDETDIDPYHIQVPGNYDPPALSKLKYSVYKFADGSCLDIVPSTLDLMYIALGQSARRTNPLEERFSKFVTNCKRNYDVVIIDCHPAGSILTKTSLQNSNHVLIPVAPDRYAVRGIGLMLRFIESHRPGDQAPQPHILFNDTPRRGTPPVEVEIRRDRRFAAFCLESTLKHYKAFAEPMGGKGFVWSSKKPWSTEAFHNALTVTQELAVRIDGSPNDEK